MEPVETADAFAQSSFAGEGGGQLAGHVPLQANWSGLLHADAEVTLQAPVDAEQHLPRHGLGLHVPEQIKTLGFVQVVGEAPVVQAQLVLQHTPVQGTGLHELLKPR